MRRPRTAGANRSIAAEGDVKGSVLVTGDRSLGVALEIHLDRRELRPRPGPYAYRLPALPERYHPRTDELDAIRTMLLDRTPRPVGILSAAGVLGMGGVGKTVLAAGLASDPAVRQALPMGAVWLTFGREAQLQVKQDELALALTGVPRLSRDVHEAHGVLSLLAGQLSGPVLVVLDDVWDADGVRAAFGSLGPNVRLLVTTRDRRVAEALGARPHEVGMLGEDAAFDFVADASGIPRAALPPESGEVVRRCGRLPLALAAVGSLVRAGVYDWKDVVDALRAAKLHEFPVRWLGDPERTDLAAVLKVSVDALSPVARQCLLDFAVLREDAPIPEQALVRLWAEQAGSSRMAKAVAAELADRSILQRSAERRYSIHDLYRDYLRDASGPPSSLHAGLVDRYRRSAQAGWSGVPPDGYFHENLVRHLVGAGEAEEAVALLFDASWLESVVHAAGVGQAVADLGFATADAEAARVAAALRLSAPQIADEPDSVRLHLCGRLTAADGPRITGLVSAARQGMGAAWLVPDVDGFLDAPGQLARVMRGHSGFVTALAVSRDGRMAASTSEDGTLVLWDLDSGGPVMRMEGHSSGVNAIALVEHRREVVSASDDSTLRIWDAGSGVPKATLASGGGTLDDLVVLADGWRAVTASSDGDLEVWDLLAHRRIRRIKAPGRVCCLAALDDGRVVSGGADGDVHLWDPLAGELLRSYGSLGNVVRFVGVGLSGTVVHAAGRGAGLHSWASEDGRPLGEIPDAPVDGRAIAMMPDGERAVSGMYDGRLRFWALRDGTEGDPIQAHGDEVSAVAALTGRSAVLSGSHDGSVRLWDLAATSARASARECGSGIYSIAFCGAARAAVGSDDGRVRLWDLTRSRIERTLHGHEGIVHAVAVHRDLRRLVSGGQDGTLCLWEVGADEPQRRVSPRRGVINKICPMPDGRFVFGGGDGGIGVIGPDGAPVLDGRDGHASSLSALAPLVDGTRVATGSNDAEIRLWDLVTGRTVRVLRGHASTVHAIAALPDGRRIVSASADGEVRVWDLEEGATVRVLGAGRLGRDGLRGGTLAPAILDVRLIPGADVAALCCGGGRVRLWDLADDREIARFEDDHAANAVAVSPEGRSLLVGNLVGRLHLFPRLGLGSRGPAAAAPSG